MFPLDSIGSRLGSERPEPEEEVVTPLGDARLWQLVGQPPEEERDVITQALRRLAESGELEELRPAA